MKIVAPVALAMAVYAAGASAQPAPRPAPYGNACFWRQNISNFNAVDDTTIFMRVGVNQIWELKLFGNCFNLSWLHSIGLRTFPSNSPICEGPNPGLSIYTRSMATGRQQCPVTSVRKLTPPEIAAIPKRALP